MKNPFATEKLLQFGYRYVTRSKGRFFLYLAVFCSLLVLLDAGSVQLISGMRLKTFDAIMKNRLLFHAADPDIVIVDIDEGSLEAMAKDYGRWPWPRQVFAEFLEMLQEQRPRAVVFDILFSSLSGHPMLPPAGLRKVSGVVLADAGLSTGWCAASRVLA